MADTWTSTEQSRFEAMKHLRIEGVRHIARMVPRLRALGLLECPKCDDPKNQRKNADGETICITCENKANHFWTNNLGRLRAEDVDVLELRWEWIETKRDIIRRCLKRGDTADLKLASELIDQLVQFGGLDIEFDTSGDEDDEAQNVPRGIAVRRPTSRRDAPTVN